MDSTIKRVKKILPKFKTTEYFTWGAIKQRCYNPNHQKFEEYGGRGITVCKRWKDSFENFLEDMGKKPTPKHTLDRIDNSKGYSPKNCRWVTRSIQGSNRRKFKKSKSKYHGVYPNQGKFQCQYRDRSGKRFHIGTFEKEEDAVKAYDKKIVENNLQDLKPLNFSGGTYV